MGRRSRKKIDPAVDVSRHLVDAASLGDPFDAARLFGRPAPLEIEVGPGGGYFLAAAAVREPDKSFLGIEISGRYAWYAAHRALRLGLDNIRIVRGDARRIFEALLPDATASAIHVYFPDPWWKSRHRKRRVMTPPFVRHVERVLLPGGYLHFWTDVREYFEDSMELLARATTLAGPYFATDGSPHDLDCQTHYERRSRLAGLTVYRAAFIRAVGP